MAEVYKGTCRADHATASGSGERPLEAWAKYAYFAIIVLAIPVWFAAAWNYIGMLRRVKGGNFLRLMFDIFWWMPDR